LDTFSPVVKLTTIHLLFAFVATYKWYLHQLDEDNVFLHKERDEEVT